MKKDYTKWHTKKSEIEHNDDTRVFFHEREVWWCSVGSNVGFEQDGKGQAFARPVLIFKKFNKEVFWALPLSTKVKTTKFYASVRLGDGVDRVAIVSQLRLTDAKRLIDKIGVIDEVNYMEIQKTVINLCSL
ncbi:MAG: type II toxin-antitoxin system PemK/MazF family toxin [bacterium]